MGIRQRIYPIIVLGLLCCGSANATLISITATGDFAGFSASASTGGIVELLHAPASAPHVSRTLSFSSNGSQSGGRIDDYFEAFEYKFILHPDAGEQYGALGMVDLDFLWTGSITTNFNSPFLNPSVHSSLFLNIMGRGTGVGSPLDMNIQKEAYFVNSPSSVMTNSYSGSDLTSSYGLQVSYGWEYTVAAILSVESAAIYDEPAPMPDTLPWWAGIVPFGLLWMLSASQKGKMA